MRRDKMRAVRRVRRMLSGRCPDAEVTTTAGGHTGWRMFLASALPAAAMFLLTASVQPSGYVPDDLRDFSRVAVALIWLGGSGVAAVWLTRAHLLAWGPRLVRLIAPAVATAAANRFVLYWTPLEDAGWRPRWYGVLRMVSDTGQAALIVLIMALLAAWVMGCGRRR